MGLFDNIGSAELFERGKYLPPDFVGVLQIKKTIAKETRRSGTGFIVEFEVVESNREDVPVGGKCTWFQGMTDKTVAFPSIKEFCAAVAGYDPSTQKEEIDAEVSPVLEEMLTTATTNPADNDLTGCNVAVETFNKKTQKGSDFTVHRWKPAE